MKRLIIYTCLLVTMALIFSSCMKTDFYCKCTDPTNPEATYDYIYDFESSRNTAKAKCENQIQSGKAIYGEDYSCVLK